MSTATHNGYDPTTGTVVTDRHGVRARAHGSNQPQKPAEPQKPGLIPRVARAISRMIPKRQAHAASNFLQLHAGEFGVTLTEGWAVTYRMPSVAEAARKVWPTSATRWFWWPVDAIAGATTLAAIFVVYLLINALGTAPRRRAALALGALTAAVYIVANLVA